MVNIEDTQIQESLARTIEDKDFSQTYEENLFYQWIDTPLGLMVAITNDEALYLLEFADGKDIKSEIKNLKHKTRSQITYEHTEVHAQIQDELKRYFDGDLQLFTTPISLFGTPFQKQVWTELIKIPYGETKSYLDIAKAIGRPTAFRAVGMTNGSNQLPVIIPCHRVINTGGSLGGYNGGLARKIWMLQHEQKYKEGK